MTTTEHAARNSVAPLRPRPTLGAADLDLIEGAIAAASARSGAAVDALDAELARATVVPQHALPPDVVRLGSTVDVEDVHTGARRTISVVLPPQANVGALRVSVLAPMGAAVIGLRTGDEIDWPMPRGTARVRVSAVRHPAAAQG